MGVAGQPAAPETRALDQGEPPIDRLPAAAARQIRSGTAAAFQPQRYAELKAAVGPVLDAWARESRIDR